MSDYKLKYPIEIDGKTVSEVGIRRPKGRDMVALGDHIAALARLEGQGAAVAPDASVFRAMVAVAANLADLGEEAAGELDIADLTEIATAAFSFLGEAQGRGEASTGGEA